MVLKRAFIGVLVLVAAVFLYIGYSSYDAGRGAASAATSTTVSAKSRTADEPISTAPATAEGAEVTSAGAADTPAAAGGVTPPATDTVQPNPPNGMTFGGSGHFQLYRQGNLTWRLNTDTGESCIVFATEEEWRKPQVYRAGCKHKS